MKTHIGRQLTYEFAQFTRGKNRILTTCLKEKNTYHSHQPTSLFHSHSFWFITPSSLNLITKEYE